MYNFAKEHGLNWVKHNILKITMKPPHATSNVEISETVSNNF